MNKYFEYFLENNKIIKEIPYILKKIKMENLKLNDEDFLKKVNKYLYKNFKIKLYTAYITLYIFEKKIKNEIIQIHFQNALLYNYKLTGIHIIKKDNKNKLKYDLEESSLLFHWSSNEEKGSSNPFNYIMQGNLRVTSFITEKNKYLTGLISEKKLQKDEKYMSLILDLILLNKEISNDDKDLILLNYDIDINKYKNDFSIIKILNEKMIRDKYIKNNI